MRLVHIWPGRHQTDGTMAITLAVSLPCTLINFLVDLSYALFDPRVSLR